MSAVNRRLSNVLFAVSLVLFVLTVVLWVRSHTFKDMLYYARSNRTIAVGSTHGRIGAEGLTIQAAGPVSAGWGYVAYNEPDAPTMPSTGWPAKLGFGYS